MPEPNHGRERHLWVDCDLALSAPRGDVDDGYALVAAARAPGCRLLGLSTVFGNTSARRAHEAAGRLLDVLGVSVPIIQGAAGPGERAGAVVAALRGLPAGTEVLALGPLTNVAAALASEPGLGERVAVSLVGGNLTSWGRFPPYWPFEFNLAKDPAATAAVFAAPMRRRLFPLPVCRGLRIGPRRLLALRAASPGGVGGYLFRHSLRWLAYAPLRYQSLRFPLWDLLPALCATGLLPVRFTRRALRPCGRGGLRQDPAALTTECAESFAAPAAWRAFLGLCH